MCVRAKAKIVPITAFDKLYGHILGQHFFETSNLDSRHKFQNQFVSNVIGHVISNNNLSALKGLEVDARDMQICGAPQTLRVTRNYRPPVQSIVTNQGEPNKHFW